MTWLDLEGTLIDDLSSRKWLDISKIVLLKSNFGIFTWGWWDQSEVDWDLIHSIEEKFSATRSDVLATKCVKVITKKDCMDFMFQKGLWSYDGWKMNLLIIRILGVINSSNAALKNISIVIGRKKPVLSKCLSMKN